MTLPIMESEIEPSMGGFVTNYPPFRRWKRAAVERLTAHDDEPIDIYVHIPFCVQRCSYCYYKTVSIGQHGDLVGGYVDCLCKEIETAAARFTLGRRPIASVYFGGGTPTLMKAPKLCQILDTIRGTFATGEPEVTVESEPVTLDSSKAKVLSRHGVNRFSIGIQSFSEDVLGGTGRRDTEARAVEAVRIALETGAVVNIDLICGLAGETDATWAHNIERSLDLGVHSITVYRLELYSNTNYYSGARGGTLELPSEAQRLDWMRYAVGRFAEAGYLPTNFYTFNKDGLNDHVHIRNRWSGRDCYGFGVSAFSSLGDDLFQNTNDLDGYLAETCVGELPLNRAYRLTGLERMIRHILLGLKTMRIDLDEFGRRHGFRLERLCDEAIRRLERDGLIHASCEAIELTPEGLLYGDHAGKTLAAFLEGLG